MTAHAIWDRCTAAAGPGPYDDFNPDSFALFIAACRANLLGSGFDAEIQPGDATRYRIAIFKTSDKRTIVINLHSLRTIEIPDRVICPTDIEHLSENRWTLHLFADFINWVQAHNTAPNPAYYNWEMARPIFNNAEHPMFGGAKDAKA